MAAAARSIPITSTSTRLDLTVQVLDLSPTVTKDDLTIFFSYCGTVDSLHLLRKGKDQPQLALVTFRQPFAYQTALLLHGAVLSGRPIRVLDIHSSTIPDMSNFSMSKEKPAAMIPPIVQATVQSMASKGIDILNKTKAEMEENFKLTTEKGRRFLVNKTRSAIGTGALWASDVLDKASNRAFELTTCSREKSDYHPNPRK